MQIMAHHVITINSLSFSYVVHLRVMQYQAPRSDQVKDTYLKAYWHASQDISALLQEVLRMQHHQLNPSELGYNQDMGPDLEHTQEEVLQTEPKIEQQQ